MRTRHGKVSVDLDGVRGLASPGRALGCRGVAPGVIRLEAGAGYTFTHHHEEQEEVYAVLAGAGVLLVDGERVPLVRGDLVRVDPEARRALRAGSDGPLLVLCAGGVPSGRYPRQAQGRYLLDDGVPHYDDPPPWCAEDPEALRRNAELAARMERARERRRERPPADDRAD